MLTLTIDIHNYIAMKVSRRLLLKTTGDVILIMEDIYNILIIHACRVRR